jgi:hypothetical protein
MGKRGERAERIKRDIGPENVKYNIFKIERERERGG